MLLGKGLGFILVTCRAFRLVVPGIQTVSHMVNVKIVLSIILFL